MPSNTFTDYLEYKGFIDDQFGFFKEEKLDSYQYWSDFFGKKTEWISVRKTYLDGTIRLSIRPANLSFRENTLHNLNGPAVIYSDGREEYHIEGVLVTQHQYAQLVIEYQNFLILK